MNDEQAGRYLTDSPYQNLLWSLLLREQRDNCQAVYFVVHLVVIEGDIEVERALSCRTDGVVAGILEIGETSETCGA